MKTVIFTIIAVLCLNAQDATAQRLRIGHRDANQAAVLDIGIAHIHPVIVQELTLLNYTNIRVTKLDISDNAFNPFYYASIGITVEYQEQGSNDMLKLSFLYPIAYDASINAYYGGSPEIGTVQSGGPANGGNPDNNFCVARNCVGCGTMRDANGKTIGCTVCIPQNTDISYSCAVESTSGMGTAKVLNALSGLLKGLISIF